MTPPSTFIGRQVAAGSRCTNTPFVVDGMGRTRSTNHRYWSHYTALRPPQGHGATCKCNSSTANLCSVLCYWCLPKMYPFIGPGSLTVHFDFDLGYRASKTLASQAGSQHAVILILQDQLVLSFHTTWAKWARRCVPVSDRNIRDPLRSSQAEWLRRNLKLDDRRSSGEFNNALGPSL